MQLVISGFQRTQPQILALLKSCIRQQERSNGKYYSSLWVKVIHFDELISCALLKLIRLCNNTTQWEKIIFFECRAKKQCILDVLFTTAMHCANLFECHALKIQRQQAQAVIYYPLVLMELTSMQHLKSLSLMGTNCLCDVQAAQALYHGLSTNYSITYFEMQDLCRSDADNTFRNINEHAIQIVAQALSEANVLQTLKFHSPTRHRTGIPLETQHWKQLLLPLRYQKTLQKLYVYCNNSFGDILHPIGTLLLHQNEALQLVEATGLLLFNESVEYLMECLTVNHTLKELKLGSTGFLSDSELTLLSLVLKHNRILQRIEIDIEVFPTSFDFGTNGMGAIVSAMERNVTMKHLVLSNFLFKSQIYGRMSDYYCNLNKAGRHLVMTNNNNNNNNNDNNEDILFVPLSLWSLILARVNTTNQFLVSHKLWTNQKSVKDEFIQDKILATRASIMYWLLREGPVLSCIRSRSDYTDQINNGGDDGVRNDGVNDDSSTCLVM